MSNETATKVLGYDENQASAVSYELQNTVIDLISLSESVGTQKAVDTVVTGLALRIAILDGIVTAEEAEKLILDNDGDFVAITKELQDRAFAKYFEV